MIVYKSSREYTCSKDTAHRIAPGESYDVSTAPSGELAFTCSRCLTKDFPVEKEDFVRAWCEVTKQSPKEAVEVWTCLSMDREAVQRGIEDIVQRLGAS